MEKGNGCKPETSREQLRKDATTPRVSHDGRQYYDADKIVKNMKAEGDFDKLRKAHLVEK